MKSEMTVTLLFILLATVSLMANSLGYTTTIINTPSSGFITYSGAAGGFWADLIQFLNMLITPIVWVFNIVASLIQLMAFQVAGMPGIIMSLITLGISVYIIIFIVKLARGQGG